MTSVPPDTKPSDVVAFLYLWKQMHRRCRSNPAYLDRGITVCQRWGDFDLFFEDMFPRPEGYWLEREDNDSGYSPENCKWATPSEQSRNKRSNNLHEINGVTKCLTDWAVEYGMNVTTVRSRLKSGYTLLGALTQTTERQIDPRTGRFLKATPC